MSTKVLIIYGILKYKKLKPFGFCIHGFIDGFSSITLIVLSNWEEHLGL